MNVALIAVQHTEVVVRLHVIGVLADRGLDGCIGLFELGHVVSNYNTPYK